MKNKIYTYKKIVTKDLTPKEALDHLAKIYPERLYVYPWDTMKEYALRCKPSLLGSVRLDPNIEFPFKTEKGLHWRNITIKESVEVDPRVVPEGLAPLSSPFLAYVGHEDQTEYLRQAGLPLEAAVKKYYGLNGSREWDPGWGPGGNYPRAVDVRTPFAKAYYPEIVACYRDCDFMQTRPLVSRDLLKAISLLFPEMRYLAQDKDGGAYLYSTKPTALFGFVPSEVAPREVEIMHGYASNQGVSWRDSLIDIWEALEDLTHTAPTSR